MRASEVARELGLTPQTVRNYAAQFSAKLGIVKEPSGLWAFSPDHIDTLRSVRDQLAAGYTYDDVAQMLENGTLGSLAVPSQLDLVKTLTAAIDNLGERIRTLEAKVDNLGEQLALPPGKQAGAFGPQTIPQTGRENTRKRSGATGAVAAVLKEIWERGRGMRR